MDMESKREIEKIEKREREREREILKKIERKRHRNKLWEIEKKQRYRERKKEMLDIKTDKERGTERKTETDW